MTAQCKCKQYHYFERVQDQPSCTCGHAMTDHRHKVTYQPKVATAAKSKRDGKKRLSGEAYAENLMKPESLANAMDTECKCMGRSCKKGLWAAGDHETDKDGLLAIRMAFYGDELDADLKKDMEKRRNQKEGYKEEGGDTSVTKRRGNLVFNLLQHQYYHDEYDLEGNPVGQPTFHCIINERQVCEPVWMASLGISLPTVKRMKKAIRGGKKTYYKDTHKASIESQSSNQDSTKWMSVTAWVIYYAQCTGDWCPERGVVYLPHVEVAHMWHEYVGEMKLLGRPDEAIAKEAYFYKVWELEPAFANYEISRLKYNFQKCKNCVNYAYALGHANNPFERDTIRCHRAAHLKMCKDERMDMESCVLKAEQELITMLCVDGWSQWSSTVPHCTQTIKGLEGLDGLTLKVTGCLAYGPPGKEVLSFYISDPTVPHDTNLNCEVIRRSLLDLASRGIGIKPELHIQGDNAGDNKSRGMLAFCMLLVKEKVAETVYLRMLICGHTHVRIDQVFSIPSKHYRSIANQMPVLQTPEAMIDSWVDAFKTIAPPDMIFIHWMFDIKAYFGCDTKKRSNVLDKMFGGHQTARSHRVKKVSNEKAKASKAASKKSTFGHVHATHGEVRVLKSGLGSDREKYLVMVKSTSERVWVSKSEVTAKGLDEAAAQQQNLADNLQPGEFLLHDSDLECEEVEAGSDGDESDGHVQKVVPVPHIFKMSMHPTLPGVPIMHYKILSTDQKWLPAKKDASGTINWKYDSKGIQYWETDPNGIQLVHSWPPELPSQVAPFQEKDWSQKEVDKIMAACAKYKAAEEGSAQQEGMQAAGRGFWSQPAGDYWEGWKASMPVEDTADVRGKMVAIAGKQKYHSKYDGVDSLHSPYKYELPKHQAASNTAMGEPEAVLRRDLSTLVESITYRNKDVYVVRTTGGGVAAADPGLSIAQPSEARPAAGTSSSGGAPMQLVAPGASYSKNNKRKEREAPSEQVAQDILSINTLPCQECGSAESTEGNEFVMCSYSIAHGSDQCGYHVECLEELAQGAPEGDWKCPRCMEHEAGNSMYEMEALLNKRAAQALQHTAACHSRNHVRCACRKKVMCTKYLVKWKGYNGNDQNTWELDDEVKKDKNLKSQFEKYLKDTTENKKCNGCKCFVCLCGDSEAKGKAEQAFQ